MNQTELMDKLNELQKARDIEDDNDNPASENDSCK